MAPWGDAKLFLCILFITCCCTVTLAQVPVDCCLTVSSKPIGKGRVADYLRQVAGQGCSIDAVILMTKHNRKLCINAEAKWLPEVMKHVDLKKFCKDNNYEDKRCKGLRRE